MNKNYFDLPDVSFTDVTTPGDAYLTYDIMLKQPLDHQFSAADLHSINQLFRHI